MVAHDDLRQMAEQRLKALGIKFPAPPEPFGTYVEAVQTGNLLFLSGMLPTEGREEKSLGGLAQSSMLKRDTRRPASRRSMCLQSRKSV